jgi:hypothetical protein
MGVTRVAVNDIRRRAVRRLAGHAGQLAGLL